MLGIQKELLKATESLEEKRIRRLNKKMAKDRRRKEDMGWDKEMMVKLQTIVRSSSYVCSDVRVYSS